MRSLPLCTLSSEEPSPTSVGEPWSKCVLLVERPSLHYDRLLSREVQPWFKVRLNSVCCRVLSHWRPLLEGKVPKGQLSTHTNPPLFKYLYLSEEPRLI